MAVAKIVCVEMTSDFGVNDTENVDTVEFVTIADGKTYALELGDTGREALAYAQAQVEKARATFAKAEAKALAEFLSVARERNTAGRTPANTDAKACRKYAQENGLDVQEKGKISADVWDAWRAAGSPGKAE